ncbi:MAG: YceI family protein [Candidatus Eremiobacteraeota bacterium]|nr:YceI family protein [Candidatus Eremiobacteraeota bacterium]
MKRCQGIVFAVALSVAGSAVASAATPQRWIVDPVHSTAQFTATHFGLSHVLGVIPIQSATIVAPQSPALPSSITATLDATGVDTRVADRDADLRSPHFFDAAQYPTISFVSTAIAPVDAKTFDATGNLTMHGVTKPVVLRTSYLGQITDPRGRQRVAYTATTTIKRSDFGMGQFPIVVGDDIAIEIDVEADPAK